MTQAGAGARPDAPSGSPVVASLLLALAVGAYAVSFGVLGVQAGLTTWQTCAMSLLVFTGASQFAAVGVVAAGGSPYAALGSALLLAARNTVYGLAMSRVLPEGRVRRLVAAHFVLDESTAMALAQHEPRRRIEAFWATGVGIYVFWNLGTWLGAVVGDRLSDPAALGLDAAFPAGFVALLLPHLSKRGGVRAGILGAAIALALTPLLPAGAPILLAALAVLVGLRREPAR
jgi:4-azaleucine resistance transporter AzlC